MKLCSNSKKHQERIDGESDDATREIRDPLQHKEAPGNAHQLDPDAKAALSP